jgi:hypothetical protein
MPNITENRLNTVISAADEAALGTAGTTLETILAFLIALTDDERKSLFGLDVQNKVFVEEALQEIDANSGVLPPYIGSATLKTDLDLYNQLDGLESRLSNLLQKISDTKRLAAHEAYSAALTAYKLFEAAHDAGIPNATNSYLRLRQRFQNQGRSADPQP